jgi:cytidyltransferase-like protein
MNIINFNDLSKIRSEHKDKKIIFCSGTFDLTHAGHVLFFEDCKKHGDILVVAVGNDFNQRVLTKGKGRPVQNESIRLKMVSSLKPVDYALLDPNAKNNDWLPLLIDFHRELEPDVYIVNEDAFDIPRRIDLIKEFPTKMIILKRTSPPEFEDISTTKMIKKIKEEVEK